ncbi:branched-chain amino acid ABC transporter permease [Chelativorans salis]|uniref:Branched-chain amino acid ABC transporter permease n=1 Tax=Chelativorans salis TaxID=2978478 RepID=A0ABT2LJ49_9HYPH|nr:branched-chain amino acid ABC transporter permease [Chelativorans sp. EGI FJ00035]MCT7374606.1 branched-chain amino acid ABC transporter permease [Chelativorans sp. EGI FJ00035]
MIVLDLALNAVATGIVLGSIYALLALGLAITFGILHIPNVAHPAIVIAGAYAVVVLNRFGLDPILAGLLWSIPFYFIGLAFYEFYARSFESRGGGNTLQSLTLFFGISLVIEIALVVAYGTDLRSVRVGYVGESLRLGTVAIPYRFLVPALITPVVVFLLWLYLSKTNTGLAIRAVAHDERAVSVAGVNPTAIKRHAFGIATALAVIAGAALVITGPVDPFAGRIHIGRVFAIVVLAGMGTIPGTLAAAIIIGVAESLVMSFASPSWAPGVAFAILLATLALRPTGLFGGVR